LTGNKRQLRLSQRHTEHCLASSMQGLDPRIVDVGFVVDKAELAAGFNPSTYTHLVSMVHNFCKC